MCRKLFFSFSFVLAMGLALVSTAHAELVGWWQFNEGSGTTALDSSSNENNGTLHDNVKWADGKIGLAMEFDGASGHIEVPFSESLRILNQGDFTIGAWLLLNTVPLSTNRIVVQQGDANGTGRSLLFVHSSNEIRSFAGGAATGSGVGVVAGEWIHATVIVTETGATDSIQMYVNGATAGAANTALGMESSEGAYFIGSHKNLGNVWDGLLDDVRIYNHALTEAELQAAMEGSGGDYPFARSPNPADGTLLSDTWVNLTWSPGDFAASHDVYLGESFDDVNGATRESPTFRGNQTSKSFLVGFPGNPYPDGLVPGTTYYWRIDEVNEAEPNSPWKGPVWSFSIAPRTAYDPIPADGAEFVDLGATLSWTPGFGAKLHHVYFGDDFDVVNNATGAPPQGTPSYKPASLESEKVYYWRVDEFDAVATYKGDVWSFTTPGAVGNARPSNGATDVEMNAILTWTPSAHAASHEVYFGTDKEAIRKANTTSPEYKGPKALGAESYDPGLLEPDTTYYWRVDEVNSVNPKSPWKGPLWTFTTGGSLLVDDFEGYDVANNEIWWSWKDGLGYAAHHNEPAYPGNGTGSAVGDETTASYTEETIVHGGGQSMPVAYDNNKQGFAKYSEVEFTLTSPRDWTANGVATLTIWFRGESSNDAEPLYVAIANRTGAPAVVVHDDAAAAQKRSWTKWVIPLSAFADKGVNLTDVDKIMIGMGTRGNQTTPGGAGKMYFDDIALHR